MAAAVPGPVGDSSFLARLGDALAMRRLPPGSSFGTAERSFEQLTGDLLSMFGQSKLSLERDKSFEAARRDTLITAERANGVDTDQEMQKLLLIEQAYAANARVIQTVDQLIQTLLEI